MAPAEAPPLPDALPPGSVVGRYEIAREIGRGGMCVVYEARHVDLDKRVALKALKPEYAAQEKVVKRFLREGKAASRVRHRHAVDVSDVGEHGGTVFLVMEYLEGEDLSRRVKRDGPMPSAEAVDTLLPVLDAIAAAHEAGVIHRDLKAANLFLARGRSGEEETRVLDFGISKLADDADVEGLTGTDAVFGTPNTMAPELLQGARNASPASDQYALGVVLYQCVTGRLPFRGGNVFATMQAIAKGEHARARALVAALPAGLDDVIERAFAYAPADRFPHVRAFGAALLPFASARGRVAWGARFSAAPVGAARAEATAPELSLVVENPSLPSGIEHDAATSQPVARPRRLAAALALVALAALAAAVALRRPAPARPAAQAPIPSSPPSPPPRSEEPPPAPPVAQVIAAPAPAPSPPAPVVAGRRASRPRAAAPSPARDAGAARASIRQQDGRIFID